jgi:putative phosphoesterase
MTFTRRSPEPPLPRIGLLSDSHGRAITTRRAVAVLRDHGAQVLLHLGDVGTVEVIDELVVDAAAHPTHTASRLVFGNTDWDLDSLARYAADLGVANDHPIGTIALDGGGVLAYTHGDRDDLMTQALKQQVRYLCHGHTHRASDTSRSGTRIINPGALFRAREYTAALLDTDADTLAFYPVAEH